MIEDCSTAKALIIPAVVTAIGDNAFLECTSLVNILYELNSELISIGSNSFKGNTDLKTIYIPSKVSSINENAFQNVTGTANTLTEIFYVDEINAIDFQTSCTTSNCFGATDFIYANYYPSLTDMYILGTGSANDNGEFVVSNAIASFDDGSSVITGYLKGSASFSSSVSLTASSTGDIFVAKVHMDGSWEWAVGAVGISGASGSYPNIGNAITTFADGTSMIAGQFMGSATFKSQITLTAPQNQYSIFVAKYNADGTNEWAVKASSAANFAVAANAITSCTDGSAFITGYMSVTITFTSTDANTVILTGGTNNEIFVVKINKDGVWQWANIATGPSYNYGYGITSFADGSSVVTGTFQKNISFSSVATGFTINDLTVPGNNHIGDIVVAKLNTAGEFLWAVQAGGDGNDQGISVVSNADGSSIVLGHFSTTASFTPVASGSIIHDLTSYGVYDIFVAKINKNGEWVWSVRAGGSNADKAESIAISSHTDGSLIVTGYTTSPTLHFNSTNGNNVSAIGDLSEVGVEGSTPSNIFVAKITGDGVWLWAELMGGNSGENKGYGATVLTDGSPMITGIYQGKSSFGDSFQQLESGGARNAFVLKLPANYNPYPPSPAPAPAPSSSFDCSGVSNGNIHVPNTVTSIGNNAFNDCSSLTSVSFESGSQLTSIGSYTFRIQGLLQSLYLHL